MRTRFLAAIAPPVVIIALGAVMLGAILPGAPPAPTPFVSTPAYVWVNQVGYLPGETKIALVETDGALAGMGFTVLASPGGQAVYTGTLGADRGAYAAFSHNYVVDFSGLAADGAYIVQLATGQQSQPFAIGADLYPNVIATIQRFFREQRCGNNNPLVHGPCHYVPGHSDDGIVANGPWKGKIIDVTGGWHDAGDYIKFVQTASYVVDEELIAYELNPGGFPAGRPGLLPPPLDEMQTGLDWLLKMHPSPDTLFYQVSDQRDHNYWRMPERDTTHPLPGLNPRPVYYGIGANIAGRTAAALALGAMAFQPYSGTYASTLLQTAKEIYALGQANPVVQHTTPADFYPEATWKDDMALGATELYRATGTPAYLTQAVSHALAAGPANQPVAYNVVNALADVELAAVVTGTTRGKLISFLKNDADAAKQYARSAYWLGTNYDWGTTSLAAGAGLDALFYARLSGDTSYMALAQEQRDYILGRNQFGVCFVVGACAHDPLYPAHPVADLSGQQITGAAVEGPVPLSQFQQQHIKLKRPDAYAAFQSKMAVYHDDVNDYVTNEPADDYAANITALLSWFGPGQ